MRVTWDDSNRAMSFGVSRGVFYPENSPGVSWNGLLSVTSKGDDAPSFIFVDGQKVVDRFVKKPSSGTIQAVTYPDEFDSYSGYSDGLTLQIPKPFGLCYRTSDEIHLYYNCQVVPSSEEYTTIGDTLTPVSFSWDFKTTPVAVPGGRPSSHLVISLDGADSDALTAFEALVYGDDDSVAQLPDPDTLVDLFESYTTVRITDNGDGTFTASGPDAFVIASPGGNTDEFQINWPSVNLIGTDEFTVYSL